MINIYEQKPKESTSDFECRVNVDIKKYLGIKQIQSTQDERGYITIVILYE
jgi:hypothetical protein